jgi:Fe-S-cluster containining protein
MEMKEILRKYCELLSKVDAWFAGCAGKHTSSITCGSGCSECCRALFDVTLLDAFYLKSGFDSLDPAIRCAVLVEAGERMVGLQRHWPDFDEPYILNYRPEEEWAILMPEDDETPCPLLGKDGTCMVYDFRPMTCRLHGLPLVDFSGEVLHDEWCTLNFRGRNPLDLQDLRWEFNDLFRKELLIFREFTERLMNKTFNELDTFIPTALMIDFAGYDWRKWFREKGFKVLR